MNLTKTPPTKPGAYLWRPIHNQVDSDLVAVFRASDGRMAAMVSGRSGVGSVERMGGEWSGPLVPVEEVEKAYWEGYKHGDDCLTGRTYTDSRARRVVEGK